MLLITPLVRTSVRRAANPVFRLAPAITASPLTLRSTRCYASSVDPDNTRMGSSLSPSQLPEGFEKLGTSPKAMSAISKLIQVMKDNGVDLQSGEKPSMWQMVKLARNEDVRSATTTVMEELKNAGIDVSPERLQAIMNSQKDFFKKGSEGDDK